jgi:membrane protein DedA with SNARE-associated domain
MEQLFIEWLKEYGYIILFIWSMMEGETGLVMAGVMVHTGDMVLITAITVAGIGGFIGDQIYFYIGRYNKDYIHKKLKSQRRKFALGTVLLRKYGWFVVFIQRYLYGLRTVIPMSIGLTKYSARVFAIINLISAFIWASITIMLANIFGEEILKVIHIAKEYWYFAAPIGIVLIGSFFVYFYKLSQPPKHRQVKN